MLSDGSHSISKLSALLCGSGFTLVSSLWNWEKARSEKSYLIWNFRDRFFPSQKLKKTKTKQRREDAISSFNGLWIDCVGFESSLVDSLVFSVCLHSPSPASFCSLNYESSVLFWCSWCPGELRRACCPHFMDGEQRYRLMSQPLLFLYELTPKSGTHVSCIWSW